MICSIAFAGNVQADEPPGCADLLREKSEQLEKLTGEQASLQEKLRLLTCTPVISSEALSQKNYQKIMDLARDTRAQRQAMADFEGFVKWMTTNISSYSKYVEAGSIAAGFARVLPIPYAGQASVFAKFVSQGTLSLNAASVSISRYLSSSQQFISKVDALSADSPSRSREISELARFADEQLLKDMGDTQLKLASISEFSTSALSFLESVNYYVGSSDEYWNKTKSFLKRSEVDKHEKSFLSESISNLKTRAGSFNSRLKLFDETVRKDAPLIKALVAYDDLVRELDLKVAKTP